MADQPAPAAPQTDSAAPGPASNLQESGYDVEVQLSDLQEDKEHPLGSATTFQELGLSVPLWHITLPYHTMALSLTSNSQTG
jgi:hypothetical protein